MMQKLKLILPRKRGKN